MTQETARLSFARWIPAAAGLALVIISLGAAIVTKAWVWTALPVGLVFGFLIQKGELCGAAAFSEVLMNKDWRKLGGIWVAVIVSMMLFALAHRMGWVPLNPKPLLWWNAILGGLVFGAGTVLAGGCISGCLYKSAMGHVNSMVALLTMPLGIALVETGALRPWFDRLKAIKTSSATGGPVTLPSLTGISYLAWAFILLALTIGVAMFLRKKAAPASSSAGTSNAWLTGAWKPWQAGIAVGILGLFAFLSTVAAGRNYPMGITHGVLHLYQLATDRSVGHDFGPVKPVPQPAPIVSQTAPPQAAQSTIKPAAPMVAVSIQPRKVSWWLMMAVLGVFLGSFMAASLAGTVRLRIREPREVVFALLGGFLVGLGAALATGCIVGNILSGWALLSVGMFVFGIATLLGNWVVTHFYLMGGTLAEIPFTFGRVFRSR